MVVLAWLHRWSGDDSLIYTRAVRQILAGNGPVLTAGERVETSTGTLWQWLVAGLTLLSGADPLTVAVYLGLPCTAAAMVFALRGAARLHPGGGWLLPFGAMVPLCVEAFWDYGTSGLETSLVFAWIAASWWLLVTCARMQSARRHLTACVVIGLGPLVRPDMALVSAVLGAALWWVIRPGARAVASGAAAGLALPVAFEVFRAGYYGLLVPMPAVAKEAGQPMWERGWAYLLDFVGPYWLWVPLFLVIVTAVTLWRPGRPVDQGMVVVVAAPVVAGLASWTYVVRVGGDFMHARMLLPGLFLMLLPVFVLPARRTTTVATLALLCWGVPCAATLQAPVRGANTDYIVYNQRLSYMHHTGQAHPVDQAAHAGRIRVLTRHLRAAQASGQRSLVLEYVYGKKYATLPLRKDLPGSVALSAVSLGHAGVVAPLDGRLVDIMGIGHPFGGHIRPYWFGKAGHEKALDPAWAVADLTPPGTAVPPAIGAQKVTAARHALTCPAMADLVASTRAPLTAARFWHNLTGAWARGSVRFDNDPRRAERELCV
ncbi:hypothetical protein G3I40_03135 [Streptomyces sp. SID14478]|uniref:hypothetical protein n=1 Tax=Streptomyces sp. SID14478 TaxID=2706073 RepID=UPI0013D9FB9D|nr:hypothetical protein [Streptomyces sp. SID14478]NEB74240.1 hypothetical protein [Streptomyces sp. SID14478]